MENESVELPVQVREKPTHRQKVTVFGFLFVLIWQIVSKRFGSIEIFETQYNILNPGELLGSFSTLLTDNFTWVGDQILYTFEELVKIVSIKEICYGIYDLFTPSIHSSFSPYQICMPIINAFYNDPLQSLFTMVTGIFVTLVVALIAQRNLPECLTPYSILCLFKNFITYIYEQIGEFLANLSSFYLVFKLDRVYEDLLLLLKPYLEIVTSPLCIFLNYLKSVESFKNPTIVLLGTATLVFFYMYGSCFYDIGISEYFYSELFTSQG